MNGRCSMWCGVVFVAMGCGGRAAVPPLSAGAQEVVIRKVDPPVACEEVGPIQGIHGRGCGLYGKRGSYEGAYTALRNLAVQRRADYVRLDSESEPHLEGQCFVNRFVLRGVAFRCRE